MPIAKTKSNFFSTEFNGDIVVLADQMLCITVA